MKLPRPILWTLLSLILIASLTFALFHFSLPHRSLLTDGDRIRTPLREAPERRILWQPAEPIPGASDADTYEPRLTADGNLMVFVQGRAGQNAELMQRRRGGGVSGAWSDPEPIPGVNSPADDLGPELSADGRALYFYSDRDGGQGGYDLWVARSGDNGSWSQPVNLGPQVNTSYNEYGPALTPDGSRLYFSSNRPRPGEVHTQRESWPATIREERGRRDYDLYASDSGSAGFDAARPLDTLNTFADEGAPALSPVGDFLYFASDRDGGLGGFDLYRARILKGRILAAENLGTAVNSPDSDLDPALSFDGFRICFSSDRPQTASTEARRYALWASASREVFTEVEPLRAGQLLWQLWSATWPWLLALLACLLSALAAFLILRNPDARRRMGQLSLMAKCLLVSLLIHAMILSGMAVWRVGSAIGEALDSPGGSRVAIGSVGSGGLASQVRGEIATVGLSAPELSSTPASLAPADLAPALTLLNAAPSPILLRPAPISLAPAETSPSTERPVELTSSPTTAAPEARTPEAAAPDAPVAEAPAPSAPLPQTPRTVLATNTSAAPVRLNAAPQDIRIPAAGAPAPIAEATGAPGSAPSTSAPAAPSAALTDARLPAAPPTPTASAARTEGTGDAAPALTSAPAPVSSPGGGSRTIALNPGRTAIAIPSTQGPSGGSSVPPGEASPAPASPSTSTFAAAPGSSTSDARLPSFEPASTANRGTQGQGGDGTAPALGNIAPRAGTLAGNTPGAATIHLAPLSGGPAPLPAGGSAPVPIADAPGAAPSTGPAVGPPTRGLATAAPGLRLPDLPPEPPVTPTETFAQRSPEVRGQIVEQHGGSAETERAVNRALSWFAAHQRADGSWSGRRFDDACGKCGDPAQVEFDAAATGITLLCYLSAGHTHQEGEHRERVARAIEWLVTRQDARGDLRGRETMYSQTVAAVALCEAFAMTRDPRLQGPARRAVAVITGVQPNSGNSRDTSVLGWQIMAVKSAERCGFTISQSVYESARAWLDNVGRGNSGRYGYAPGDRPSPAATAEAMFVRQLLGAGRDDPAMAESARFILTAPPAWRREAPTYYWYYATLALFQQQGPEWARWNEGLVRELLAHQHTEGAAAGSWDPQDDWSRLGGRLYQTAVCTLSLQVYYRYRLANPEP